MEPMITYETISRVHRAEKDVKLGKLPDGFFPAVQQWLSHKKSRDDVNSIIETENAKKLLDYIVNLRTRKIITAALDSARGSAPPANMMVEEAQFFDKMLFQLKAQQNEMKERLFGAGFLIEQKMEEARRSVEEMKGQNVVLERKETTMPAVQPHHGEDLAAEQAKPISQLHIAAEKKPEASQQAIIADQKPLKPLNSTKKVRILMELPRFVDMNGAEYGPFKAGDTAEVPDDVLRLLSMRRAAETVN